MPAQTLNVFNRSSIYFTTVRKEVGTEGGRERCGQASAVCMANIDINTISTSSVASPQSNRTGIILSSRLEIGRQFGRLTNGNTNDKYRRRRRRRKLDWSPSADVDSACTRSQHSTRRNSERNGGYTIRTAERPG